MTILRSVMAGCGAYLPAKKMSNADFAKFLDTSDEWIVERTGIRNRHIAEKGEKTSDLALAAARQALANADITAADLDIVIVATTTPDDTFPSTATKVQAGLGMTRGAAFDIQAVCTGFIYGLAVADNFIRCGQAKNVLVIGAETMSRILDWTDRGTCVLFGDGAGAVVLRAEEGTGAVTDRGILNTKIFSDGRLGGLLYVDGGPSSTGTVGQLRMEGREVFRHAVVNIAAAIEASMKETGLKAEDINWFVPHQANRRILEGTARKLGIPTEKLVMTIAEHGNTSAASVPLALAEAVRDGRIKRNDLLLFEAMGAGFTWGAALVRW